jgi:sensor histidine kinase YesM
MEVIMLFLLKEILYSTVEAAVIIYFYNRMLMEYDMAKLKFFIYTIFTGIAIQALTPLVGVQLFFKMALVVVIFMLVFKLIYKKINYVKTLMYICGMIVLLLFSDIIVGSMIYLITDIQPNVIFSDSGYRVLGAVVSKGIWFTLINFIFLRSYKKYHIKKNQIYFINIVVVSNIMYLIFVIWMMTLVDTSMSTQKHIIVIVTLSVILMGFGLIGLFSRILKQNEIELEWKMKEDSYIQQYKFVRKISDINNELRSQRHDFSNHLNTMMGLAYMDKNQDLKDYLQGLIGDVNELNKEFITSNPVINGLLGIKVQEAKELGIKFDLEVMYPDSSNIRENDLVAILGNLIDNAIEASSKTEEKEVNFKLAYKNNRTTIHIKNSKDSAVDIKSIGKVGFTTKEDSQLHGFGIYNVKKIVNEYEGMYDFKDLDKVFEVKIMV